VNGERGQMTRPYRILTTALHSLALFMAMMLSAAPTAAADDLATMTSLSEKALRLYDELDFQRAEVVLQQALKVAESAGLDNAPLTARIHLYLGMVRLAGLQQRDAAAEQFRIAKRIDPAVAPPEGLFNPEVAALFAATQPDGAQSTQPAQKSGEEADGTGSESGDRENAAPPPLAGVHHKPRKAKRQVDANPDEEDESSGEPRPFFLALGLGTGGGTATGHIDMKAGVNPNKAPGHFALSQLGQATIAAGYFWSRAVLVALEARLQLVTGPTPHCESGGTNCTSTPGFAAAGLVKVSYFLGQEALRGFVTGGLGAGAIRQVVTLTGLSDCGRTGTQQCVDTVTGGPLLLAVGGGAAYLLDPLVLLAGVTTNLGVPNVMLNVDLTIGAGLRF
jgi:hypothetical protein